MRQDGLSSGGVLRFKEREFFGIGAKKPTGPVTPSVVSVVDNQASPTIYSGSVGINIPRSNDEIKSDMGNFFLVEFLASMLLTFSAIYVPETGGDLMAQYVPSLTIIAVIVTLKDRRYFCPDGTPMVSAVMFSAGAYRCKGGMAYTELFFRVLGQCIGVVPVFAGYVYFNRSLFKHGTIEFGYIPRDDSILPIPSDSMSEVLRIISESVATSIECVAVPYSLVPLLRVRKRRDGGGVAILSKPSSLPPRNTDLWFAAAGLGLIHYALQRVFRATMNPFVTSMHIVAAGAADTLFLRLFGHVIGLAFACVYCHWFEPLKVFSDSVYGAEVEEV